VRRLFTPKQANRALPLIRSIVEDITSAGHRLHQIAIGASPELDPVGIHELESERELLVLKISELGCEYRARGLLEGAVDFPAQIEHQNVLLNWQTGEERVLWFRISGKGLSNRTPIPEYLLTPQKGATPIGRFPSPH